MTDTDTAQTTERVTKRDLAEGKIEKVMSDRTAMVPISDFGLKFENALQVAEAAKLMATAGPMLPEWLQGNPGGCWGIILRATELGISPLTLANWSYLVENKGVKRVAYESQFYHAIIEARAPIKGRLQHEIIGEGDAMKCRVFATFKGATKESSHLSKTLAELRPGLNDRGTRKGSPLWDRKPEVQMFYDTSRDWARIFCPDILGGVYARDELEDEDVRADSAIDVSPKLRERLRGPVGEGFMDAKADIEAAINSARVQEKPGKAKAGDETAVVLTDPPNDAGRAAASSSEAAAVYPFPAAADDATTTGGTDATQ